MKGSDLEFNTLRLNVRPWATNDPVAPLARILTPAVLAHLPTPLQDSDPKRWIAARLEESEVYAVLTQGKLIGIVLIARLDVPHLGYLLAEEAWGKGNASELVQGLVHAMPQREIRAGVARGNPASARVLEKAGFTVLEEGPAMVMYHLNRP